MLSRLVAATERSLGRLAVFAFRRPWPTLAVALIVCGLAVFGGRRLRLDTDLVGLLPSSFPSVQALDALSERFGSIGYVVVVGMDAEPEALERFARDAMQRIEKVEGISYVDARRPIDFFMDHALFYADLADLEVARDRLAARERWERRRRNPMYIDLEEGDPPALDFEDLRAKYGDRSEQRFLTQQLTDGWYIDRDRRMIALMARPAEGSMDVNFTVRVVNAVEGALADLDPATYGADFHWATTGRYKKKYDQKVQVEKDLGSASVLSLLLMVAYLAIHFRSVSAVGLIMVPLAMGLLWTMGLTGFVFGALNILTGFIGAILLGIGIDHGIHLLSRYETERGAGVAPALAVAGAFGSTGRAVVVAGLTTLVAFAGVGMSEFRAFREFGIISAAGIILVGLAYWSVLPALLALRERRGHRPRQVVDRASPFVRRLPRIAPAVAVAGLVFVAFAVSALPQLHFDFDFEALSDSNLPTFRLDKDVNRILGYHQNPIVVLTDDADEERAVALALRQRSLGRGAQTRVDFVASVADLVPTQQAEKAAVLDEIHRILAKVSPDKLGPDERKLRDRGLKMAAARPFDRDGLPVGIKRQFLSVQADGDDGFVLVFPNITLSDGMEVADLAEEVRGAVLAGKQPIYAGEPMIMADILDMVRREAMPVLATTLVLVALTLWFFLGHFGAALLCFLAAATSLLVTLGLAGLAGLDLNYMNMLMVPVLFGLSVDGAVHVIGRGAGEAAIGSVFTEVGRAIGGAALTTMLGFGVLNLANHPGLNSLGTLAVLGMAVSLLVNLALLPATLTLVSRYGGKR